MDADSSEASSDAATRGQYPKFGTRQELIEQLVDEASKNSAFLELLFSF